MTSEDRLIERMSFDPDGCWRFIGSKNKGYGQIWIGTQCVQAHRLSYTLFVGEIPEGLDIDHECHNRAALRGLCVRGQDCPHRSCIRPSHLRPKTRRANLLDSPLTEASLKIGGGAW